MSKERWHRHGTLKSLVTALFSHMVPRMHPVESIGSLRVCASRYGVQVQTRESTVPGMTWVFLRPNKKTPPVIRQAGSNSLSPQS